MPGISVYAIAALDRDALWSPAIMVGVTHAWRNSLAEPGGTASFTLDAASLDTCALRLRLSVIEARACGSALVGRLSARGDNTSAPATVARPFVTIGGAAVLTAGLGSIVELSARLGAGLTLLRDSYEFAPTIFYRADRITACLDRAGPPSRRAKWLRPREAGDARHSVGERAFPVFGDEALRQHARLGVSAELGQRLDFERGRLGPEAARGIPVLVMAQELEGALARPSHQRGTCGVDHQDLIAQIARRRGHRSTVGWRSRGHAG
jgi:hypothetical protein